MGNHIRLWLLALIPAVFLNSQSFADCPPGYPEDLPCPQAPYETVEIEHEDRKKRLQRLSSGSARPIFYTERLNPAEHGLPDFPVSIPILRVVFDQDVFFDVDSSVIRPEAYSVLQTVAASLKREPPDVALFIAGHTDWTGSEDYNFNLGLDRAEAVARDLVRRGIYQAGVYRVSFGELVPIATNTTAKGRAKNRRVEFLFGANPTAVVKWLEKQPVQTCAARSQNEVSSCKRKIVIEAAKVEVDPGAQSKVRALDRRLVEVENSTDLSRAEIEAEKEKIEIERQKIPVDVTTKKIPITLRRK